MISSLWAVLVSSAIASGGVVQLDLTRSSRLGQHHRQFRGGRLARRDADAISVDLANEQTTFTTEFEVGSNKQTLHAVIDTGSSDLWVMDSSNPYCASISQQDDNDPNAQVSDISPDSSQIQCYAEYIFDSQKSTSFVANSSAPFRIKYGDYTFANGTYGADDIVIGGSTVKGANFALATRANSSEAVFGIGLAALEASVDTRQLLDTGGDARGLNTTYSNFPMQLKEQGLINRVAYSLYLNDPLEKTGTLLLGGVDHAKYSGGLQTVPLVSSYFGVDVPVDFSIVMDSVSGYNSNGQSAQIVNGSTYVLLDSGSTYMHLPEEVLDPIMQSIGAVYSWRLGYYFVDCDGGWEGGGLEFDLSGVKIQVPFTDVIAKMRVSYRKKSEIICLVGMVPTSDLYILGDTFLRSAYAVFDLENFEVSLAQVKPDVTASSIESIPAAGQVPGATPAPSYSSIDAGFEYNTTFATIFGLSTVDPQFYDTVTYLPFSSDLGPLASLTFNLLGFGDTSATATAESSGTASQIVETSSNSGVGPSAGPGPGVLPSVASSPSGSSESTAETEPIETSLTSAFASSSGGLESSFDFGSGTSAFGSEFSALSRESSILGRDSSILASFASASTATSSELRLGSESSGSASGSTSGSASGSASGNGGSGSNDSAGLPSIAITTLLAAICSVALMI